MNSVRVADEYRFKTSSPCGRNQVETQILIETPSLYGWSILTPDSWLLTPVYIPDELWTQLDQYLKDHPEQNPSSVVHEGLAEKLRPKNGSKLLSLAGIVENAPTDASLHRSVETLSA